MNKNAVELMTKLVEQIKEEELNDQSKDAIQDNLKEMCLTLGIIAAELTELRQHFVGYHPEENKLVDLDF